MRKFIRTTLLGGVTVILPLVILVLAFKWLFGIIYNAIKPLAQLVGKYALLQKGYHEALAVLIVLVLIVGVCFFVGLMVRTRSGRWMLTAFESGLLNRAPGYKIVKETVNQFIGKKASPFASVALVQLFQNDTQVTAFVTDRHDNGLVTVFVPTGPNPTSGFIYHIDQCYVHLVDIPVETAMRSIISCGVGSQALIKAVRK